MSLATIRPPNRVRVRNMARERFQLDIAGARVEMRRVRADVLCGIARRRAERYDVQWRSRIADFSHRCSRLTLIGTACEIRAAGASVQRAAR